MRATTKLLPSRSGNLGIFVLNNPKPFHALTLDMIHAFQDTLEAWYHDKTLHAILLKSSKDTKRPAFCAGGDVKSVHLSCINDSQKSNHGIGKPGVPSAEFFRQEYHVNLSLATAKIPQISLWDGIVMGGGVGISIYGTFRVSTENTLFAMPETGIGLFPDVGSLYWMPRMLPHGTAVYLALTGHHLKAADLLHTGLATHYVPSARLEELEAALVQATDPLPSAQTPEQVVAEVLSSFHEIPEEDPAHSTLAQNTPHIDQVFSPALTDSSYGVEQIFASLQTLNNNPFATQTLQTLQKMSPTSLKVTLAGLRKSTQLSSLAEDLRMEYRMSQHCMKEHSNFHEGIRAMLVDKDGKPQWKPERVEDVTEEMVEGFFEPLKYEWEIPKEVSKL